ncbi:MAG: metallophosphoesterase family protein [Crenarchaeota archaeon]|nr:metallophosphoesterase family protein [Thermoproteota archaeon]
MTRLLVVSDVHGNIYALKAVVEGVRGWDRIIVLGDLVDYGPRPGEVIDYLREHDALIVRGNHDHAVAYGVDCRCGEATHWLSVWFRENITNKVLSRRDKEFLSMLPLTSELEDSNVRVVLVHASPSNPLYSYLYPWLDDSSICSMLRPGLRLEGGARDCMNGGVYLIGHTHLQFLRTVGGTLVANPGSTGEPRDGDPRAAYSVFDLESSTISFGRARYDVDRVIGDLEDLGVPDPYLSALKVMFREGRVP